jgi:phospholipase C
MSSRRDPPSTRNADAGPAGGAAHAASPSRRDFLKASAAVAGGSLLGACGGSDDAAAFGAAPLGNFDHMVVVMFENRSFDSLLGYLYAPGTVPRNQTFNGLAGGDFRNPVPAYINDGHADVATRISPGTDADMQNPNPDPGERYQFVNTQLFNIVEPPFNAPAPGQTPTMTGFVHDYCNNFVAGNGRNPTFDEYRVIMDSFGPQQLPVLATLARGFAVYDAWHCAVPSQTFTNRSFFHASSASVFVVNQQYNKLLDYVAPTIFNRLQDVGRSWRIYYDETQVIPMTALIHAPALFPYWLTHFGTMADFYADVANGTLPDYAFVEPRMIFNHNDYHPPAPSFTIGNIPIGATSDVRAGDLLLHQVYSAVRDSAAASGSNALNTLLLVTFDEHGGCYDHVVPPAAVTPQVLQPAGEQGFMFDRLGVRVPAIAISAYTEAGSVIHDPMHHGALVHTLCEKFGLPHLTERDRTAPDLSNAFNLGSARDPSTWPVTVPRPVPPDATDTDPLGPTLAPQPLNDLERHLVGLTMAWFNGVEPADADIPTTLGAAYTLLRQLAQGAFGLQR